MTDDLKSVNVTKPISDLFTHYVDGLGVGYGECLSECLSDYLGVLKNTLSRRGDKELKIILKSFEDKFQDFFTNLKNERRRDVYDVFLTRILAEEDFVPLNPPTSPRKIPQLIYKDIKKIINKNPFLYNKKTKAKIINIIDRAILFRMIKDDSLLSNQTYRELRLKRLLKQESASQIDWNYLYDNTKW